MKKILITLCLSILTIGCTKVEEVDLDKIIESNNYTIVDVRTPEEYSEGHLVDAINIPYDQIDENIDLDKNKTILVYCRSGNRSGIAYDILEDLGFKVYDMGAFAEIDLPKE